MDPVLTINYLLTMIFTSVNTLLGYSLLIVSKVVKYKYDFYLSKHSQLREYRKKPSLKNSLYQSIYERRSMCAGEMWIRW